jgi:hypothetical protein
MGVVNSRSSSSSLGAFPWCRLALPVVMLMILWGIVICVCLFHDVRFDRIRRALIRESLGIEDTSPSVTHFDLYASSMLIPASLFWDDVRLLMHIDCVDNVIMIGV